MDKLITEHRFYKFLLPSLLGAILFVVPIYQDGNLTIPIAVIANYLLYLMGNYSLTIIWLLISFSAIITVAHKLIAISILKKKYKV